MKTYKNEVSITRGETFTLDNYLVNKDGSPYIVSKHLSNPYWLLSISNSAYPQEGRYLKNYWLDVDNVKFDTTVAIPLTAFKTGPTSVTPLYTKFSDVPSLPITGYLNGNMVTIEDGTDCVLYEEDVEGRIYKYYNDETQTWEDYDCRLIKAFSREDTSQLSSQKYVYSIQLVSGVTTFDYLVNLAAEHDVPNVSNDLTKIYNELVNKGVTFPSQFDVSQPLAIIDTSYVILEPTLMKVTNDLKGDIAW